MLCTQLPRHLESRTHHNLSHLLLRVELLVVRVVLDSTPDGILSSPTSGMTVFGLHGFGALGPVFPLVIASQPLEPCLVVESDAIATKSSNSEIEVCIARIPPAPSRNLHDFRSSPRKLHTVLWKSKSLVNSWIPLFNPYASGVCVARMMISAPV